MSNTLLADLDMPVEIRCLGCKPLQPLEPRQVFVAKCAACLRKDWRSSEPLPRCSDCNQPIYGTPHLAGDLGHDDDSGPVPVVTICEHCKEARG